MKAFVDSREPVPVKTAAHDKLGYEVDTMEQADFYLPEEDVAIERKEASDFASSTTDGRLSKQADRMIAEHEHVYLIIENSIESYFDGDTYQIDRLYNPRYSYISGNSLTGMQTSLAVKRGIKIIYTESVEQTLYAVNRIFERHLDGEHENESGGYVKTADTGEVDDAQVAMLMQIRGISEEKARDILDLDMMYNGIASIAQHSRNWEYGDTGKLKKALMSVDGIGPTLAERVINAFQ